LMLDVLRRDRPLQHAEVAADLDLVIGDALALRILGDPGRVNHSAISSAPSATMRPAAEASMPSQSCSTAAVCCPKTGGEASLVGISEIVQGGPTMRMLPEVGCSTCLISFRCATWGCASASR